MIQTDLVGEDETRLYQISLYLVMEEEKKGGVGSFIELTVKSIKSWLVYNNKYIRGKVKIRGSRMALSLANERVPTQAELRKIPK